MEPDTVPLNQSGGTGKAFTLIELLVVISILIVLISLLLPVLKGARSAAQAAGCLSNARQLTMAALNYVYEHNGGFPRLASTLPWASDAWTIETRWFSTLSSYFGDWDVLVDPARDNEGEENPSGREMNYWVIGHAYMFWDERGVASGWAVQTNIDEIPVPAKSMLSNCVYQGWGGQVQPALYPDSFLPEVGGGIHNGTESFTFVDGHGAMYETEPISSHFHHSYAYTYPPRRKPGNAEWWAMPYFPDAYPYIYGSSVR